jgi:hypothetical protein
MNPVLLKGQPLSLTEQLREEKRKLGLSQQKLAVVRNQSEHPGWLGNDTSQQKNRYI